MTFASPSWWMNATKCAGKFRLNAPRGEAYEAILNVQSIEIARKYYRLFKEFIAAGKVSAAIKEKCIDFPKIAITYTVTENDENSISNRQAMEESLADYNRMFGTNFALDSLPAYHTNLRETNPAPADVIRDFWDAMSVIEIRIEEIIRNQIDSFVKEWCAQKKDVIAILNTFKKGDTVSLTTDYEAYSQTHAGVSKLKYNRRAREAVLELIEKIRPLRDK